MKNTLFYSTSILVRLLTVNMKKFLTPKIRKMCHPILVTLLKKCNPIIVNPVVKKKNLAQRKTNSSFECTFAFVLRCVRNQHSLLQMRLSLKNKINIFI